MKANRQDWPESRQSRMSREEKKAGGGFCQGQKTTGRQNPPVPGLYDPRFEHDNCGIGAVVNIKGVKTHRTVEQALHIVENLEHRAGKDGEGKTGDGVPQVLPEGDKASGN